MDTNLVEMLIKTMAANQASGSDGLNSLLVAGLILLAAVAPTLVSLAAYLQAKAAKLEAGIVAVSQAVTTKETQGTLEKVHVAVNSERTAMVERLEAINLVVSDLKTKVEDLRLDKERLAATVNAANKKSQGEAPGSVLN